MSPNKKIAIKNPLKAIYILCLVILLIVQFQGYDNAIKWEVTTEASKQETPEIAVDGSLITMNVSSTKYLLTELYTGSEISTNINIEITLMLLSWLGIFIVLVGVSYQKALKFALGIGLYALFLNFLQLDQLTFFSSTGKGNLLIFFLVTTLPLVYARFYNPTLSPYVRLIFIVILSSLCFYFGSSDVILALRHVDVNVYFGMFIVGSIFLFFVSDLPIFGMLYLVTNSAGKDNHLHFIFSGILYITNLILYYLQTIGVISISFSLFNPVYFLVISALIALKSIPYTSEFFSKRINKHSFYLFVIGSGITLSSFMSQCFYRGMDASIEGLHDTILFFHLSSALMFFLYILYNFSQPLSKGYAVYKILHHEQHIPFFTTKLAVLVGIYTLYTLSDAKTLSRLKVGYYANQGDLEEYKGNTELSKEYYEYADLMFYNTHYPNYKLGKIYQKKGNNQLAKLYFEKASQINPSTYTYMNDVFLDFKTNQSISNAKLDIAGKLFGNNTEVLNNKGFVYIENNDLESAEKIFEKLKPSQKWNQAPIVNRWAVYYKKGKLVDKDPMKIEDFKNGKFNVKANILLSIKNPIQLKIDTLALNKDYFLHKIAFLLNYLPLAKTDTTLENIVYQVSDNLYNNDLKSRLNKNLALYYYNNGEINKSFKLLKLLSYSGDQPDIYCNDLGIMAYHQRAYSLALKYFENAIGYGNKTAVLNKAECLFQLEKKEEIQKWLLEKVRKNPSLTQKSNEMLAKVQTPSLLPKTQKKGDALPDLSEDQSLNDEQLISIAQKNAFDKRRIISILDILEKRGNPKTYDIILETIKINQFDIDLKVKYAFICLNQNLTQYAEDMLFDLEENMSKEDYHQLVAKFYDLRSKIRKADASWN